MNSPVQLARSIRPHLPYIPGPVFNVKDFRFGATGDGSTDDSSAIQAALDAANTAGGGTVHLPAGTYILDAATLNVYANTIVQGAGWDTVLKMGDGAGSTDATTSTGLISLIAADTQSNITIRDLALDGNKTNNASGQLNQGIRLDNCSRVTIHNVYAHDFAGTTTTGQEAAGINLRGDSAYDADTVISSCFAEDNNGYGIGTYRAGGVVIQGCIADGNLNHGISLSGDSATTRRNIVNACLVRGNGQSGVNLEYQYQAIVSNVISYDNSGSQGGIRFHNGTRIIIENYISQGDTKGIVCGTATASQPRDVQITNAIIISSLHDGIELQAGSGSDVHWQLANLFLDGCGAAGTYNAISIEANIDYVHVESAVIQDPTGRGIYVAGCGQVSIQSCDVDNAGSHGIEVTNTCGTATIQGCNVTNSAAVGIRAYMDTYGVIANNVATSNGTAGINLSSSTARVTVTGNICETNGTHGILLDSIGDYAGATVTGNLCHANGTSSANTYSGITLNNCLDVTATGNTCTDDGSGTQDQKYGIEETGTCDYNIFVGNVTRGNRTGAIYETGGNSKSAHNIGVTSHDV